MLRTEFLAVGMVQSLRKFGCGDPGWLLWHSWSPDLIAKEQAKILPTEILVNVKIRRQILKRNKLFCNPS